MEETPGTRQVRKHCLSFLSTERNNAHKYYMVAILAISILTAVGSNHTEGVLRMRQDADTTLRIVGPTPQLRKQILQQCGTLSNTL